MARLPLPGHRARRLRLPPGLTCATDSAQARSIQRGAVFLRSAGDRGMGPFLADTLQQELRIAGIPWRVAAAADSLLTP